MSEHFLANIEYCRTVVDQFKSLLLFTHIPAALVTLGLSFFVFIKNKGALLSKILFGISIGFALWASLNLLIWLRFDSPEVVMTAWAPIEAVKIFTFFLCWYFVYVFVEKKNFSIIQKISWSVLMMVIFALSITSLNLSGYNLPECIAIENTVFSNFALFTEILLSALLIGYIVFNIFKKRKDPILLKQYSILGGGVLTFVLSFFILGKIAEATQNYSYEAIGLFGMAIFTASMAYLIFKYSLFNIKVFATQVLVVVLVILTASQITFATGYTVILAVITTIFSIVFGYFLIRSIQKEIAQRKRLEQLSFELEKANLALAGTNTKLKGLDKLKTEFLSLASHQLRSPLTAIKGYASMMEEGAFGKLTEEQSGAAKRIYASAQGLVNLVEDLLNVSKIEQGGMQYEFMPTDLSKLVQDLAGEVRIPVENKKLELKVSIPKNDRFMASADPMKIRQVFLNLVDNSVKYTQQGYIEIGLKRDSGKNIIFYVRDTGVGITPDTKQKLFDKFSRGEAGKLNTGGSGLGLYLAQEIAKAHKGTVDVVSEGVGKGSLFTVSLPPVASQKDGSYITT